MLSQVQLGVASDNPTALRLYKRCGMTKRFRYDTYERSSRHYDSNTHDTADAARPTGTPTRIRSATASG